MSRRGLLRSISAGGLAIGLPGGPLAFAQGGTSGGALIIGQDPEPLALTSAASIDPGSIAVSGKIFDRLFFMGVDGKLTPQLATGLSLSADGKAVTLSLRPGVLWHDGKPFTSADVAYSLTEVWKKHHSRGYMSYVNVIGVDTPDSLTAVIRLSQPAPYISESLADGESQVVPTHLYAGTDVLTNPHNRDPIGTGPFRFVRWERGSYILLERNPHYWDAPRPHLDQVYFRFLKDGAATVAALETGAIHYVSGSNVPLTNVERLKKTPSIVVERFDSSYSPTLLGFGFNLDRPIFKDVRVRQAIAHAIDREFILKNVWQGLGSLSDSPVPPQNVEFHASDVPKYPFDLAKAEALLDQAGYGRQADGTRLTFTCDPKMPNALVTKAAQFIRATLARIGVRVDIRTQSLGEYLDRVFTRRDFDTIIYTSGFAIDPALGIQRFYWTKTFQPGVPFSNAVHYSVPEVDALLEAAQVELDKAKRRALYVEAQQAIQRDVPIIPLLFPDVIVLHSRRLRNAAQYRNDNLSRAVIDPT